MRVYTKELINLTLLISLQQFLFSGQTVYAQKETEEKPLNTNLTSRWHLEGGILVGAGLDEHEVGVTTDNKTIAISGGGGLGFNLILGYGLSPVWDLGLGLGIQQSSLLPEVENAEGDFTRFTISANFKYHILVSSSGMINLGGGIGYYVAGDLDLDVSAVAGGEHNIFTYDNAPGFHMFTEYEGFFNANFSWLVGLKYTRVSYDLHSVVSNGTAIPLEALPEATKDQLSRLDGSAIDFTVSLIYYF